MESEDGVHNLNKSVYRAKHLFPTYIVRYTLVETSENLINERLNF